MDIFDGLTALGGLCLFLFGMQIMAEALGLMLPGTALMPSTAPELRQAAAGRDFSRAWR